MSVKSLRCSGLIAFILTIGVSTNICRSAEENFPMQKFDLLFLSDFCSQWLRDECKAPSWCAGYDYNQSGSVNFIDFTWFCDRWMDDLWPKCWSCRTQCHGDADCDGDVDNDDIEIFTNAMYTSYMLGNLDPRADFNRNGFVDVSDFNIIRSSLLIGIPLLDCPMGGTWPPFM